MKKTVYISGPVTGLPIEEVRARFAKYQAEIEQQGFRVYNPVRFIERVNECRAATDRKPISDYNTIMGLCLNMLCLSDEVHMLPGWQESKGATLEREVAFRLGIPVVYS